MPRPYYNKYPKYNYKKSRHVDKKLLVSSGPLAANTQANTILYTAPVACTLKGLRINGSLNGTTINANANISWAVLVVREGRIPNSINTGTSGDFYVPEQEVWAWGVGKAATLTTTGDNSWIYEFDIAPGTSRKMEEGDKLYISIVSDDPADALINTQVFAYQ